MYIQLQSWLSNTDESFIPARLGLAGQAGRLLSFTLSLWVWFVVAEEELNVAENKLNDRNDQYHTTSSELNKGL